MPTVIIGADLCPIEGNQACFQRGDAVSLFHDLLPEFSAADLVLANLECPLIRQSSPIPKTGPTFGAPEDCITTNASAHRPPPAGRRVVLIGAIQITTLGIPSVAPFRSVIQFCYEYLPVAQNCH